MTRGPAADARVPAILGPDGRPLRPGAALGRGGEATVYALAGRADLAVKLYHRADAERAAKLAAMIARPPADPARGAGHVALAWPEAVVTDTGGTVVGFLMPRLPSGMRPLHQLSHPGSRRRGAPGVDWRFLVRVGRNLAAAVAALHAAGHVIGDLNESNVLVSERALVSLVDLDSIQVRGDERVFRCPVGTGATTPPELQGRRFDAVDRRPAHDRFALAVLLWQLLMEGGHPFAGVWRGEGEAPTLEANIAARRSPLLGNRMLTRAPAAPPPKLLPPRLRRLARRGLGGRPAARPSAAVWRGALERAEAELVACRIQPAHVHGAHLRSCPWCARADRLGADPYPDPGAAGAPRPARGAPLPPALPPLPRFRGSPLALARRLPVLTLLVTLATLTGGLALSGPVTQWTGGDGAGGGWSARGAAALALLLPWLAALAGGWGWARAPGPGFARLLGAERWTRHLGVGGGVAFGLSELSGRFFGFGSVRSGDWLLLPTLWLLALAASVAGERLAAGRSRRS